LFRAGALRARASRDYYDNKEVALSANPGAGEAREGHSEIAAIMRFVYLGFVRPDPAAQPEAPFNAGFPGSEA